MYLHDTQELGDLGRFSLHHAFRQVTRAVSRAVPKEIKRPVMSVIKPIRHLTQTRGFRRGVGFALAIPTGGISLSLLSKKPLKTAAEIALTEAAIAAAAYGGYAAYGALTAPSAGAAETAATVDFGFAPAIEAPSAVAAPSTGFSWAGAFKTLTTGIETAGKVLPAVFSAGKFLGARPSGAADQTGGAYGSGFGPASGIPGFTPGFDTGAGIIPGASPAGAPPDQLQPGEQPAQDMTPWIIGGGIVLVGFLVTRGMRKRR